MKISSNILLIAAAVLFFALIGGFNMYMGWESRLIKILLTGGLVFLTIRLKKSEKPLYRKGAFLIILFLALGTAMAEPYISHLITGHHFHHHFCFK